MNRTAIALTLVASAIPGSALAQDPLREVIIGEAADLSGGWLGETPHFVMQGVVQGTSFAIALPDIANAPNIAAFEGKREYAPDGTPNRFLDFEVALQAVIGGIERSIELEFENADFSTHALPASFALQETEFPEGALSTLEVQFEWESAGTSVNAEALAHPGTLVLHLDSGTPDDKGLKADGLIGGFASVDADETQLLISFTVPVVEYEIED